MDSMSYKSFVHFFYEVKKSAKAPTSEKSRKRPRSTVSPSPQNSLGTPESKKPTEAPLVEEVFPDGDNLSELLGFDSVTLNNAFLVREI